MMQLTEFVRRDGNCAIPDEEKEDETREAADAEAGHETVAEEVVDVVQQLKAHQNEEPGSEKSKNFFQPVFLWLSFV